MTAEARNRPAKRERRILRKDVVAVECYEFELQVGRVV